MTPKWLEGSSGNRFAVDDPATRQVLAEVADGTPQDGKLALDAACNAQEAWAARNPRERGEALRAAYKLLVRRIDSFAAVITAEMGKSLEEAKSEVLYAAEFLRWYAEEAVRISGQFRRAPASGMLHLVERRAVGPCLLITPWNFPLAMATRKIGPALAAGCSCVVKPSELTPLTTLLFAELMAEVGLPDGVLNVVPTANAPELTEFLLADPRLRKVSFTGSTAVGREILRGAAGNVLRTSMELGGNAPFVVLDDADLEVAVEGAVQAKLRNVGQACTAANRFILQRGIADAFASRLAERFSDCKVGSGNTDGSIVGPMISEAARSRVHGILEQATADGAEILAGGFIPIGDGYFYPPTVLFGVSPKSQVFQQEIFGPVAPIHVVADLPEAINVANATTSGLAGYVFTRSLDAAFTARASLDVGMLGVNTGLVSDPAAPFGGVKQSGLGREGGAEGIEEYLTIHYAALSVPNGTEAPHRESLALR